MAQALTRAAEDRACEAFVEIGSGVFSGPVELSRHTTLRGHGRDATVLRASIANRAANRLRLERLSLRAPPGPAVVVAHGSAATELREVTIDAASRHGVRQSGGSLTLSDVLITATRGGSALYDGAAIFVDQGTRARFEGVSLLGNAQGLVALGDLTRVTASRLEVRDSTFNAGFSGDVPNGEGTGAVEIRHATLLLEDGTISGGVGIGLVARDRARLHARRVRILGVRQLPSPHSGYGGIGMLLMFSRIELHDVECAGMPISIVDWQSVPKVTGLLLRDATLGIAIFSSDDVGRIHECLGTVRAERVERLSERLLPGGGLPFPASQDVRGSAFCIATRDGPRCEGSYGTFVPCVRVPWE